MFRIENRVSSDTNVPYLIIDGVEIGAMTNCYHGSSGTVNNCGYGMAGKTITFNYFGANGKELKATNFGYLEITGAHTHTGAWTMGKTEMTRTCTTCGAEETASYTAYRWEVNDDVFQSVATDGSYVENVLTGDAGTIVDGLFTDVRRTMTTGVTLKHNKPWVIQWNAKGNWSGILLSSHSAATAGMDILFKKNNTSDNRPGLVIGGRASSYTNYGVKMSSVKSYFADFAVWRLENQVNNDGTNMVFLYINDTFIADMTCYFVDASATDGTKGDYVNGRDLYYKYMGMGTSHDICAMTLDYLEIWPNGKPTVQEEPDEPEHVCEFVETDEVVPGEDCEHVGYTVWACECGETENRPNEVYGEHAWDEGIHTDGTCVEFGSTYYECGLCGETKDVADTVYGDHNFATFVETVKGADCQTSGYDVYKCQWCEETENRTNEAAVGDHNYATFVETVNGATCQDAGKDIYSCECGATTEIENAEATGEHGFSEYVKRVEGANCQTSGYDIWKCAWCEETKTIETTIMGEHNFTIDGGHTDGTCQTLGYTTWHCSICANEDKIVYDEEVADHNFDNYVTTVNGADCQTAGYDVYKCHWCEETENRTNEEAVGEHNYATFVETVKGDDCQTNGYDVYKCVCGETENRPNEVKGDHSFGEWVMDSAFESLTRTCACGETESANFAQEIWDSETREYSYVGYQDFEEALAAAQGIYDFLYLMVDAEIEDLYLSAGTWLDLNGHVLTANSVYVDDVDAYIVDFKYGDGTGLLKAPKDMVRLPENNWGMLSIWDAEQEGYVFAYCQYFQDMMDTNTPNTLKFYFLPEYYEEHLALLAAGKEVSGVEMKIKMSWTKDGVADSRVLTFSNYDQLIQQFLDGYDPETGKFAQAFRLTVTGTDLVDEGSLQFMVFFESVTGAIETLGQGQ